MNKKARKEQLEKIAEDAALTKIAQDAAISTDNPDDYSKKVFDMLLERMDISIPELED